MLATLVLAVGVLHVASSEPTESAEQLPMFNRISSIVCETDSCAKTAKAIKASMNESADPCEDFYAYTCGGYIAAHPFDGSSHSTLGDIDKLIRPIRQSLLESTNGKQFDSEKKAKSFYRQCIDEDLRDSLRGLPVLDYITEVLGTDWPLLNPNWDASRFNLSKVLLRAGLRGYDPLFSLGVGSTLVDPSVNRVIFGPSSSLYTSKEILDSGSGDTFTESYFELMSDVGQLIKRDARTQGSFNWLTRDLVEILDFETDLVNSTMSAVESQNLKAVLQVPLENVTSKVFFRSKFSKSLEPHLRELMSAVGLSHLINSRTEVVVSDSKFFRNVDDLLVSLELLGKDGNKILANYIGWKILHSNLDVLSKDYREANAQEKKRTKPKQVEDLKDRTVTKQCADDTIRFFPFVSSALYVRDVIPPSLKSKGLTMATDIFESFRRMIKAADWLDEQTRQAATKKLNALMSIVAYADVIRDNTSAVDNEYKNYNLAGFYFESRQAFLRTSVIESLKLLAKRNDRADPFRLFGDITTVNAFYDPTVNVIQILAAIMEREVFDPARPQYLNYGALGMIFGHETTHGFDNMGSQFDEQGRMRDWWTTSTFQKFLLRSQQLVKQYSALSVKSGKVNGELTLGENIADNGGMKAAFQAYQLFQSRQKDPEPALPGLEKLSPQQLFFIAYGQVWCSVMSPKTELTNLLTDPHSPPKVRVNAVVSNMKQFADAFKCPSGSNMNPVVKNAVW